MIALGVILLILGVLLPLPSVWMIGWIVVAIGVLLWVFGNFGPEYRVYGRKHWF